MLLSYFNFVILLRHKFSTLTWNLNLQIQALENRLAEGQVFLEFERILKKKPNADFSTAMLPENLSRNRFKDVFPYEENRVRLTPTSENKTGYINASHLSVSIFDFEFFFFLLKHLNLWMCFLFVVF